ncbi:hypothetical protein KY289_001133 [Solanum tuberosum]|nr:hypothetical protein KY289_001133 [Solanum tuberosum]
MRSNLKIQGVVDTQMQVIASEQNCEQLTSYMQNSDQGTNTSDIPPSNKPHNNEITKDYDNSHQSQKLPTSTPHDLNKLTSNFDKHTLSLQNKHHVHPENSHRNTNHVTSSNTYKNKPVPEPVPFTVIQSYATRLRANQAKNEVLIELSVPKITTRQGLSAVIFKKDDYMVNLAARCRFNLVGEFTHTMPKIELIPQSFILQTQLTEGVKIAHFNVRHIYIDLDYEEDHVFVWNKQKMYIEEQLMRLQV